MAAGVLPAPGTELGPCVDECDHVDCRETRKAAAAECMVCGKPIGYETRLYRSPFGEFSHAACEEKAVEAARKGFGHG